MKYVIGIVVGLIVLGVAFLAFIQWLCTQTS